MGVLVKADRKFLIKIMIEENMNLKELAEKIGISETTAQRIIDKKPLQPATISKICQNLNVEVDDVVDWNGC